MSIFPRAVTPGGTLTIHQRITMLPPAQDARGFAERALWLRGPDGSERQLVDEPAWLIGESMAPGAVGQRPPLSLLGDQAALERACEATSQALLADRGALDTTRGLVEALGARLLAQMSTREQEALIGELGLLRRSFHAYHVHHVEPDAALGRYEVIPRTARRGVLGQSSTAAWDYFLVERLEPIAVERRGDGCRAVVRNPSDEACLARVLVRGDEQDRVETRFVAFAGARDTVIELPTRGGLLFYADRSRPTVLSPVPADRVLWRDQTIETRAEPARLELCVRWPVRQAAGEPTRPGAAELLAALERGDRLALPDAHARVWEAIDGIRLESELRARFDADALDDLLAAGLVRGS